MASVARVATAPVVRVVTAVICVMVAAGAGIPVRQAAAQSNAVSDSLTTAFDAGGVRVIHRRSPANEIVSANLYMLGGTRHVSHATAGVEPVLLLASERGTGRFTREAMRRTLARSGSSIVVNAERDWTVVGLRTTVGGFRDAWAVFADRIAAPRLAAADVRTVREQVLAALAQLGDSPDALAERLADSVAFAGHAYGISPGGNAQSIAAIDSSAVRAYHRETFVRSRMLLVIVGDVARPTIDSLVRTSLGVLPQGAYRWTLPDTLPRRPVSVHREARALPTNYIIGYAPGPRADHPDHAAVRIAAAVLSGRLFAEVRSRQSLTYAVHAPFVERAVSAVGLYVSTTDPVAALAAMRTEIRALQTADVDDRSLLTLIQQFITEYFLGNETNAAQADYLARSQLYQGDWRSGDAFVQRLRAVTAADVRRVMRAYFRDMNFAMVGDASRLPDSALSDWR